LGSFFQIAWTVVATCLPGLVTRTTYGFVAHGETIAFGRYVLLRQLRMLGPVEIWLGLQRSAAGVEKLVVIKRLSEAVAQDERLAGELLEEARIAGQLAHVNIAQVLDVGESEGSYYLAMEHVQGKSLRSVFQALDETGTLLPVEHAIHIGIQLCAALSHAHEHKDLHDNQLNVVHGALSPDNVFVTFAGDVKVAEFGLLASKKGADDTPIAYPAPEQVRGDPLDPRTDLYALGMMLLELTTGKAPQQRPPSFAPGYPPKLAAILLQAAARRRAHRHPSASELLSQLEVFAKRSEIRTSHGAFAAFLRGLFPDAEQRILREHREAKLINGPRSEAPTLPDTRSSHPPMLPPSEQPPLETGMEWAGLRPLTTAPPSAGTWRPRADTNRNTIAGIALAIGVAVGLLAGSLKRDAPTAKPAAVPSPPSAPAPEAAEVGSLDIQSEPTGASVFLEGELTPEPTPTTLGKLPLGRSLRVRVARAGFETYQADVTLTKDRAREKVVARLSPATMTLHLGIDAPDPAVWVDGKYTSARVLPGLAIEQDHKIAVSAPGRIGKIVIFRSEQGGDKNLELKLEPARVMR
jgi:serine/threonine-protein kinase